MTRKIALADLQKAVDQAYELYKSDSNGSVDARLQGVDENSFGIVVTLTDGTVVKKGDTTVKSPLGDIAKIPLSVVLLSQNTPDELVKKSGTCCCKCGHIKPEVGICPHGVRAVSAVEPNGDPEGKWNLLVDTAIKMMGSEPELNVKLFENIVAVLNAKNAVDAFAATEYTLYDDTESSLNLFAKLTSMQADAEQLSMMAATVAADGICPANEQVAFDGRISASVVTLAAVLSKHRQRRAWLMKTGLPARFSFGGAIAGILPGVAGIAVYSPKLSDCGLSTRGAEAVKYIMNELQLNVFSSARVKFI
jgi:glutaminase